MKKENKVFKEIIQPFIVLVGICAVVAVLLAVIHSVTEPVIIDNQLKAAEETRSKALPEATSFREVEIDAELLGIDSAYVDEGGAGYVLSAKRKGYGGYVTVTLGLDTDGKILSIQADVSTETTGVGSKAGDEKYLSNYIGASGNADSVDTLSGATYSSGAVKESVNAMLAAFEIIKEAE